MTHHITSPDGTPASRFAFGTMQFGDKADEAASAGMFEACLAAGITHFDTADAYTEGRSEQILGRLAAPHRDRLTIATKVNYAEGNSPAIMRASLDTSRQRLDMDMVDILYLHRFDPKSDIDASLETFADMKSRGQIRYVGLSNFAAWQVMKTQCLAQKHGLRVDVLQPMYNLVKRQAEVEILPMCADQGILCAPYSPLGGGLLTGKYRGEATGRIVENQMYAKRYEAAWMKQAALDLASLAADLGQHPATLAVAWAARHPSKPTPIISARSAEQLAPSLAALSFDMDDALYARLSALSPTPAPATDRTEEQ